MSDTHKELAKLREPFPPSVVGKLPRNIAKNADKRTCNICGGYHAPAGIHLDYVGHAEVTDRLLSVDPEWTWEPFSVDERGLPAFIYNNNGQPIGLWIKLTILGVTRYGYGSVEAGKFDAVKELIGDALRNAAMRFGVALVLWAKSELESQVSETGSGAPEGSNPSSPGGGESEPTAAVGTPSDEAAPSQDSSPEGTASQSARKDVSTSPVPSGEPLDAVLRIKSYIGDHEGKAKVVKAKVAKFCVEQNFAEVPESWENAPASVLEAVAAELPEVVNA